MEDTVFKQRVIVYVDGFNFYYGLKKYEWEKYYWLDMVKFFESFMGTNQELVAVKYFSAKVADLEKGIRQNAFFQANRQNIKFKLILGKYLKKEIECFKCHHIIRTYEEKETDVRIATQIIVDAYQRNCDAAIVVSADSDLIPAIELSYEVDHKVHIWFPPSQHSSNLTVMGSGRPLYLQHYEARFRQSIFPDTVHLRFSNFDLNIPEKWKNFQKHGKKEDNP